MATSMETDVTAAAAAYEATLYPPAHKLSVLLFEDVQNTDELRAALLSGALPEFALVNPDMVASAFHLSLAASTALLHDRNGSLHVKTLHAELLYALAPSSNISEAFRVFGAGQGDTKVLVAFIDAAPQDIARVAAMVKGRPVKDVRAHLDARPLPEARLARLRKVFKLGAPAAAAGAGGKGGKKQAAEGEEDKREEDEIDRAIISRVAAKGVL